MEPQDRKFQDVTPPPDLRLITACVLCSFLVGLGNSAEARGCFAPGFNAATITTGWAHSNGVSGLSFGDALTFTGPTSTRNLIIPP